MKEMLILLDFKNQKLAACQISYSQGYSYWVSNALHFSYMEMFSRIHIKTYFLCQKR